MGLYSNSNKWRFYDWIVFDGSVRFIMRESDLRQHFYSGADRVVVPCCDQIMKGGDSYGRDRSSSCSLGVTSRHREYDE